MRSSRTTRSVTYLGYAKRELPHPSELVAQPQRRLAGVLAPRRDAECAARSDRAGVPRAAAEPEAANSAGIREDSRDAHERAPSRVRDLEARCAQRAQEDGAQ